MAGIVNHFPGGGGGGSNRWVLVAGNQPTDAGGWTTVGAAYVDPTKGPPACLLRCTLEAADASAACMARLWNADDALAVGGAGGELTIAAPTPTAAQLALVAGVTEGFPNAPRTYWLQIKMVGASVLPVACKSAFVEQG